VSDAQGAVGLNKADSVTSDDNQPAARLSWLRKWWPLVVVVLTFALSALVYPSLAADPTFREWALGTTGFALALVVVIWLNIRFRDGGGSGGGDGFWGGDGGDGGNGGGD
jgi:hypothetical protein